MLLACLTLSLFSVCTSFKYEPTWSSLDRRPTPSWYDDAKFGIFLHWGVFSVPSFGDEWFWWFWKGIHSPMYVDFMKKNYRPDFTYQEFAPQFTAEFFNPDEWADIFAASGARYVVLTSKHHEGFTLWPSNASWNWNAVDVGPKRDLVGDLAASVRKKSLKFGLYHSLFEWFNRLYIADREEGFNTQRFVEGKTMPELYDIVTKYKPDILWSDGKGQANSSYWNSTGFLAWLYNDSPVRETIATNDRWGTDTACKHGGYYTCRDRYNPGHLINHKWENAMTVDRVSWGYRREATLHDILTMDELTQSLAETVSCGGNLLLNVGPTHDGKIVPIFEERLRQMGAWLKVNGEAIYSTHPWIYQNDTVTPGVWYTSRNSIVYAIFLDWPQNSLLHLGAVNPDHQTTMHLLGYPPEIGWNAAVDIGVNVNLPLLPSSLMPCEWAWVVKIEGLLQTKKMSASAPKIDTKVDETLKFLPQAP